MFTGKLLKQVVDKFTNGIMRLVRRGRAVPHLLTEELLHQAGDYGVAHVAIREEDGVADFALKDTGFTARGITILAIERGDRVLPFPKAEETVLVGDYLLCYGKVAEMINLTQ